MPKSIVTLYIDDSSLRLMITDGKRIQEWADLSLEPGLIQNTAVIKEAEVVAKIKQLFENRKVKDKKIMVGMSGFHCLTRPITLPQLPEAMLDEAVRREAARVLPVPLEQLYISWQTIPAPEEGKTQVFLVAIPCKMADDLFKALHQAGLQPSFLNLKPLLLARVVKEAVAVIVDVQTTEFDVVIVTDGVPQPVRTIPFAEESLSWQEKLAVISSELDRTITFYNSNNPDKSLASNTPIFASGELANEPELCQSLSDELGYPVLPLPSPLEYPEELDLSRYSVNIGLALQSGKEARPSVVSLNALPAPYQPKPISLINILAVPGAVVLALLLVFLVLFVQTTSADIASIRAQLNNTNVLFQKKVAQRQELAGNIAELERKITETETSHNSFTVALDSLEKQTARINGDLGVTMESLPSVISLSSISHANSIFTISGRAPGAKMVLSYLLKLDASGRFGEIAITNMTSTNITSGNMTWIEDEEMDFTLLPSLQPPGKWVSSIKAAIGGLPTAIRVTSITSTDGTLTMSGWASREDEVSSYVRNLEDTGKFIEINITRMTRVEGEGMNFSLVIKLGE
ncbi:PilN domain-containing protein [Chloroflexota bacterium]